jgi:predicted nucleic acid-binding protein
MTIADTDVLIDYLAGKVEADRVERLLRGDVLGTTVITRGVPSLGLDDTAADAASEIRRAGHSIGMADSLIAGIAISKGGSL